MANPYAGMTMKEKINLGRRRILCCLAHLLKGCDNVGLPDLQKLYLHVFERDLNKEEYRCLFDLRRVKDIFHKFMADDIELSTDMAKTGSLYIHLKRPLKEAIGEECPEELIKCAAVTEGNVAVDHQLNEMEKSAASAPMKPAKPAYRMLESSDEEEGEMKVVVIAAKNAKENEAIVKGRVGMKLANGKIEAKVQQTKPQENGEEENDVENEGNFHLDGAMGGGRGQMVEEMYSDEESNDGEEEMEQQVNVPKMMNRQSKMQIPVAAKLDRSTPINNLLTTIFAYVQLESPIKANDLFTKIGHSFHVDSGQKFESLRAFVNFVQDNSGNAIKVQAFGGNEYFLVWNEKAWEASMFVEVLKMGSQIMAKRIGGNKE